MSTTLATRPKGIIAQLESKDFQNKVAEVLGKSMTPARFAAIAVNYVRKNPKLQQCDPVSFFACAKRAAELSLNLDGRDCALVPYGQECTMIIQYHGEKKLVERAGNVRLIRAEVLCENDEFTHNLGRITRHTWDIREPRGKIIGAYCQVIFKDDTEHSEILSLSDIESCRSRSKVQNGAWKTDFAMMCRKTAIHRACRQLPWIADIPDEADDYIDVSSTVQGFVGKSLPAPEQFDTPGEFPKDAPEIAQEQPAEAPQTAKRTMPAGLVENALQAIRARLKAENIKESDFQFWIGGPLESFTSEHVLNLAGNIDAEIVQFRKADSGE